MGLAEKIIVRNSSMWFKSGWLVIGVNIIIWRYMFCGRVLFSS